MQDLSVVSMDHQSNRDGTGGTLYWEKTSEVTFGRIDRDWKGSKRGERFDSEAGVGGDR